MSSHAVHETETPANHIARDLNSDFQFIADRLPVEVKEAPPGETFTLCSVEGIGVLWAKYAGARRDESGQAMMQYVVQVGAVADGIRSQIALSKHFGLTYQTLHQIGQLTDIEPIHGEDLGGCPEPLGVLAFAVRSLREEFARLHGDNLEHTAEIVQLDIHRVV